MKRIVIIGAGFAGQSAAHTLAWHSAELEITLLDTRSHFDFLPLLPDILSDRVSADAASTPLSALARGSRIRLIQDRVTGIDPAAMRITGESGPYTYDYALLACGTETNLYGRIDAGQHAYRFDSIADAARLRAAVRSHRHSAYVVAGGGYTGIEVASHLRLMIQGKHIPVLIVEKGSSIASALPEWMRQYARANLERMHVQILENREVTSVEAAGCSLSDGRTIPGAAVVWVAGVKAPDFTRSLPCGKGTQGRLAVDPCLRLDEHLFAAGDCAWIAPAGQPLRMSVQFAHAGGRNAAANILQSLRGRPLHAFHPLDPGYVVPMANGRACGSVFGVSLRGRLPSVLHYVMCAFRSHGYSRRLLILRGLQSSRVTPEPEE